jgi:hypothetical protein
MLCDYCGNSMGEDETGIYVLADAKGGHIFCAGERLRELEEAKEGLEDAVNDTLRF